LSRLDNTSRCPAADRCANCGAFNPLEITTFTTPVGVYCQTLCTPCVDAEWWPRLSWRQAVELVLAHLEHIGIDADQAAELLEAERSGDDEPGVGR
jgi:hypothetical protein